MTQAAPALGQEEHRAWLAFAVASASIFMFVLDAGLVSVALPDIERAFPDSSRATVSWASTGYLVTVAGLMLVAGRLGDVHGRRRIFRIGLVITVVGAVATAFAPTIAALIAARMLQGAGGALVTAVGLPLVLSDLPVDRQRFAIGIWGSVGSLAAVLGPTVGAELVDLAGWRTTVGLIGPIAAATLLAGRSTLRESADPGAPDRLDPASVVLATVGIGAIALGLSQSRVWGWSDARTIVALAAGAGSVALFAARSVGHAEPLVRRSIFANRAYAGATAAAGLQQIGFFAWFFSTSFVLREIWDWSVRETGQALSLAFVLSTFTGWLSGRVAERIGYFIPTAIGAVVVGASTIYWVAAFEAEPSFWGVYLPGAVLFGAGGGSCGILTTGMALHSVDPDEHGMAYAAHQTIRRVSSAMGVALMAALLGEATGDELLGGARNVWLMVAGAHLLMIVPLVPHRHRDRPSR